MKKQVIAYDFIATECGRDCYQVEMANGKTSLVWLPSYALDTIDLEAEIRKQL